jgi:hypothetical protein
MNMNTLSKSVRSEVSNITETSVNNTGTAPVGLIVTVVTAVAGLIVTAVTVFGVSIN